MTSATQPRPPRSGPAGAPFVLRPATVADAGTITALVRDLAEYEREPEAATAGPADFERALGEGTGVGCVLAEVEGADGPEVAGMALWYTTFSTWQGRPGMHLEDLFVRPEHRRLGIGRAFFGELARTCAQRGFGRLEWSVLDWNAPAQDFYTALGATPMDEWTVWRLDGDRLERLAPPTDQ